MIALSLTLYYSLAIALVGAAVLFAVRQNKRDAAVAYDRLLMDLARWEHTPPMPEPLPDKSPIDESMNNNMLSVSYLGDAATLAIAPLLMQVVRKFLDKPTERERLIDSLEGVLERPNELPQG